MEFFSTGNKLENVKINVKSGTDDTFNLIRKCSYEYANMNMDTPPSDLTFI